MLQRIQSVYLFIVFIFAVLFGVLPLAYFPVDAPEMPLRLLQYRVFMDAFAEMYGQWLGGVLIVLFSAIMLITVYTTFQYKNRLHQIAMGKLNILLHVVLIMATFFFLDTIRGQVDATDFSYGPAVIFPVISLIFILLSNKAIRKDENLVRAADRLR